MKNDELMAKTENELIEEIKKSENSLADSIKKVISGVLKDTSSVKKGRRVVARLKTILGFKLRLKGL